MGIRDKLYKAHEKGVNHWELAKRNSNLFGIMSEHVPASDFKRMEDQYGKNDGFLKTQEQEYENMGLLEKVAFNTGYLWG
ncbi:hypothetical protein HOD05_00885 [Candidatus Woesearchaeota archaeon]|jgi:hypothetical protein|nr:hypothetical protein [Candidatus Woesearchaeota archaeon]MBT4150962.1 hypothetical protein [Candidatus Woesearchaeota archaeon]MBT4247335.1 hypothetical protein [Candidatus Woesearchaeota archaeon]MBT4433752.1 hypothetical protein [Candidatus Woesearchaeota archaeon]MBT7332500.1 hypothetical protein [Candidatus Woesearchaeota archaeon]